MPRTIQAALDQFAVTRVDLDPTQVAEARRSRDFLKTSLVAAMNASPGLPRMTGEVVQFGSFARRTKIRPLDDVDLMFVVEIGSITAQETWFRTGKTGEMTVEPTPMGLYSLSTGRVPVERRFLNDAGRVSSRAVVNEVRARLGSVPQYGRTEIKPDGAAIMLDLASRPWKFDVVPALPIVDLFGTTLYYLIPNGRGGWQKTDPRRDAKRMTEANQRGGGRLLRLVRLVKYWNVQHGLPLGSYHLETLCLSAFPWMMPSDPLAALQSCFTHIASAVYHTCPDPKGLGPDLDSHLSYAQRQRISSLAHSAAQTLQQAVGVAAWKSHQTASRHLQQVFGPFFPVCD
ncbi:hypothetical protein [Deinococcus humi]|uniref:Nucleotidyltransferase n=1 Tax=Deinococcus humi TaxID=662880 RepID=A0A7W8K076_9DEIO|nr:hypothetical protein [Deinococcus humi]MBB5364839.1 hypothetical protein [Deinococcus humi]GGO33940.1 hypothetical protein GCM10008949_33970 [Deinococcus humi]